MGSSSRAATPMFKWLGVAASIFAIAAADSNASSGKFLGAIAAIILGAIVAYAFWISIEPVIRDRDPSLTWVVAGLALIAIVKILAIPFFPGFGADVGSYQAWALQIATNGPARTYQQGYFLDYPPGYLYALWIVGALARAFDVSGDTLRLMTESPPVIADFALALAAYVFIKRFSAPRFAIATALFIAL